MAQEHHKFLKVLMNDPLFPNLSSMRYGNWYGRAWSALPCAAAHASGHKLMLRQSGETLRRGQS